MNSIPKSAPIVAPGGRPSDSLLQVTKEALRTQLLSSLRQERGLGCQLSTVACSC